MLQLIERPRFRWFDEDCAMNVFRRKACLWKDDVFSHHGFFSEKQSNFTGAARFTFVADATRFTFPPQSPQRVNLRAASECG